MMPAILAIPRVLTVLRQILLADAALTSRLSTAPPALGGGPAIYTEGAVPEGATMPYLTLGPFTERSESTMGDGAKWASAVTTTTKLVTKSQDITRNLETVECVVRLLHGTPLTVEDYAAGISVLDLVVDGYQELVGPDVILHYPTLWTVHVHQPS
jgi:hypothetical protein